MHPRPHLPPQRPGAKIEKTSFFGLSLPAAFYIFVCFVCIQYNPMDNHVLNAESQIADFVANTEADLFSYIDQKDYHTVLNNEENMPYVLRMGGIFLCLDGEGDVIINEQKYHLRPCTMCLAFPGTIVQSLRTDEAFKGYTIALNIAFIRDIDISSATSIYMLIRDYPCVTLTREQTDSIYELCEMLRSKNARKDYPFRMQINSQILLTLCYELAAIYTQYHPVKRQPCTRQDTLFRRFLSLLATDITLSREVQYYADKLCITPKYLTIITRQASERSATEWISQTVIVKAKSLLSGTQLTVQQISNRLNFPNPSFFGQYFLRHTGMTPKEFRRSKSQ